jgi:hypothetical protein
MIRFQDSFSIVVHKHPYVLVRIVLQLYRGDRVCSAAVSSSVTVHYKPVSFAHPRKVCTYRRVAMLRQYAMGTPAGGAAAAAPEGGAIEGPSALIFIHLLVVDACNPTAVPCMVR